MTSISNISQFVALIETDFGNKFYIENKTNVVSFHEGIFNETQNFCKLGCNLIRHWLAGQLSSTQTSSFPTTVKTCSVDHGSSNLLTQAQFSLTSVPYATAAEITFPQSSYWSPTGLFTAIRGSQIQDSHVYLRVLSPSQPYQALTSANQFSEVLRIDYLYFRLSRTYNIITSLPTCWQGMKFPVIYMKGAKRFLLHCTVYLGNWPLESYITFPGDF